MYELTDRMVRNTVLTWYSATNEHRPVEEFIMMLAENIEMRYPNRPDPIYGRDAFRAWYADVLAKYFDETHEVESWDITIEKNRASAVAVVRWEARSWIAGAAKSSYEAFLSRQRFDIERSEAGVAIVRKIVETFKPTGPLYDVGA